MTPNSLSLSALLRERSELQKDLIAFTKSYDIMKTRVRESLDDPRTPPPLYKWSGTRAVMGAQEMAIQSLGQSLHEHDEAIKLVEDGIVENSDVPGQPLLGVLEGGDHEL